MGNRGISQAGAVKSAVVPAKTQNPANFDGFSVLVRGIMGLPLSGRDKAETIRRLLKGK